MPGMGGPQGSGNSLIVQAFHSALLHQVAVVLVVLVVLFAAWNGMRSLQYSRAIARGEAFPAPRPPAAAEPYARRILRLGFGTLWIFDGALQLQSGMPLGLPTSILQPAAAMSPGWVRHLVGFAITTWSRHPSTAAAAVVWMQLGIGLMLLVAPRGRWSRAAGLMSVGWGLVVWAFGSAFGGLFAPGASILFGAPGAGVIYVVAGAIIALPESAWAGRRLGRILTASIGAFLVLMAVLQAWPGRGFWQGMQSGRPGTLAGMVQQMAGTPQPRLLSSLVSSFAGFDRAFGWEVNLFTVVALATIGAGLLWGRRWLLPAVAAFVVLGLADWILVEDLGFWGGTGTDPNSMVPMLVLTVTGYLAVMRAPATLTTGEVAPTAPAPTGGSADRYGRWWERVDPGYAGRLAAALGAVVIMLVGAAPMVGASVDHSSDPLLAESVDGAPSITDGPAPGFRLVDQRGRPVSLADLRGKTVVLTFLDPVCTTDCPIIAQELKTAGQKLGPDASKIRFVAIAANPIYYSVAAVDAFDRQEGLGSQTNWLFLTGALSELQSVWNAYGVDAATAPAGGMVSHTELVYLVDSHGIIRRIMGSDPGSPTLTAVHQSFAGLLASQITQVMHP